MLSQNELIEQFGFNEYNEAMQRVWATLDEGAKRSIPFQVLLKLIKADLEVEF